MIFSGGGAIQLQICRINSLNPFDFEGRRYNMKPCCISAQIDWLVAINKPRGHVANDRFVLEDPRESLIHSSRIINFPFYLCFQIWSRDGSVNKDTLRPVAPIMIHGEKRKNRAKFGVPIDALRINLTVRD
jgi:hypothetical protein